MRVPPAAYIFTVAAMAAASARAAEKAADEDIRGGWHALTLRVGGTPRMGVSPWVVAWKDPPPPFFEASLQYAVRLRFLHVGVLGALQTYSAAVVGIADLAIPYDRWDFVFGVGYGRAWMWDTTYVKGSGVRFEGHLGAAYAIFPRLSVGAELGALAEVYEARGVSESQTSLGGFTFRLITRYLF